MKTDQVFRKLYQTSRIFLKRNSATILTCIGSVGVIGTAVLAVKATPKAMESIRVAKEEKENLSMFEVAKVAGLAYIPAGVVGLSTIACIFGANVINKKQQASLISAYALLDRSYKEYRSKVIDLIGADSHDQIMTEIINDHLKDEDIPSTEGKMLFYEVNSDKFFESTMNEVLSAEYHFNRNFILRTYACLNELLDFLDVDRITGGNTIGWSIEAGEVFYGYSWIDFYHEDAELSDGRKCCIIKTPFPPTADFIDVWDCE